MTIRPVEVGYNMSYQEENDLIEYHKEESKIQNNDLKYEVWA